MKLIVVLALFLIISECVLAQDWAKATAPPPPNEKLKVGDKIPFTELHNMINYPKKTFKFSDHKPKLIILDFWATTCTSCVATWPKTIALQKQFGDDLQIVLVNKFERESLIRPYIEKRKQMKGVDMKLPMSLRDSTIWKYFPKRGVPCYVWISPGGVTGSITDGLQFTSENIKQWIESGPFKMPQIIDDFHNVDPSSPIFVAGNGGDPVGGDFVWTSSLTRGRLNIVGDARFICNPDQGYAITITGSGIHRLYAHAYNNRIRPDDIVPQYFGGLPASRIKLEVSDTTKYYRRKAGNLEGLYNYQLISEEAASLEKLQEIMSQDLHRYFGLKATWEKQKKMCIVWSMFDSTLAHQKKTSIARDVYIGDDEISLDSVRVRDAIRFMEIGTSKYFNCPYPIVDETNYKGLLIGIRYEGNGFDLKQFDKDMSRYGIHIRLEPREVDVLVLREPN
ncbi:MAG: TlpA disulfide reductase family protein [Bacteroidota bacterium]